MVTLCISLCNDAVKLILAPDETMSDQNLSQALDMGITKPITVTKEKASTYLGTSSWIKSFRTSLHGIAEIDEGMVVSNASSHYLIIVA